MVKFSEENDKNLIEKYQDEIFYKNEAFSKITNLFVEHLKFLEKIDSESKELYNDLKKHDFEMCGNFYKIMDEMLIKIGY